MGFCVFGNIAVAARYAQQAHGLQRVFIIDYDVHHGNGTNDAFYNDPDIFFLSTHQVRNHLSNQAILLRNSSGFALVGAFPQFDIPDALIISSLGLYIIVWCWHDGQDGSYPGTGKMSEVGAGPGEGSTLNLPLPGGSGDDTMAHVFEEVIVPAAQRFKPDIILVSAG